MRCGSASVSTPVSNQPNHPAGSVAKRQPASCARSTLRARAASISLVRNWPEYPLDAAPVPHRAGCAGARHGGATGPARCTAPGLFQRGGGGEGGQQFGVSGSGSTNAGGAARWPMRQWCSCAVPQITAQKCPGRCGCRCRPRPHANHADWPTARYGARCQATVARGVVQHAHIQLGLVRCAVSGLTSRSGASARHGQDAHAQCGQTRKLHAPTVLRDLHPPPNRPPAAGCVGRYPAHGWHRR